MFVICNSILLSSKCDGDGDGDGDVYLLTECAVDNDYPVCTASVYNRGSHVSHQTVMTRMAITDDNLGGDCDDVKPVS